jgi:uncharacterized LabA/DUF88 family protein
MILPVSKKTIVYVDGFNLYYRLLKGTPWKWLDLSRLVPYLFPSGTNEVVAIKYFTALVKPRQDDPAQPARQQAYLRALRTLPNLEIIEGTFLTNPMKAPLVLCEDCKTLGTIVSVLKSQEKGSDVNLATHLILDALENKFEVAIVFTSDTDLAFPISVAKEKFDKEIIVVYSKNYVSDPLKKAATFVKQLRTGGHLSGLQFANEIRDTNGTVKKPSSWYEAVPCEKCGCKRHHKHDR